MDIEGLTVADVMQRDVVTAEPDPTVAELLELLEEHDVSGVPVVGPNDDVQGVVSVSDVARARGRGGDALKPPTSGVEDLPTDGGRLARYRCRADELVPGAGSSVGPERADGRRRADPNGRGR